jgi:hypothetical protein
MRCRSAIVALACASFVFAADQTKAPDQSYVLEGLPDILTAIPKELPTGENAKLGDLTQAEIQQILKATLPADANIDPLTYYVLHLAYHPKQLPASIQDAWYVYFAGWQKPSWRQLLNDPEINDHFAEARLLGAEKMTLLYLHYNVPVVQVTTTGVESNISDRLTKLLPAGGNSAENVEQLKLFWQSFNTGYPAATNPIRVAVVAASALVDPAAITAATYTTDLGKTRTAIGVIARTEAAAQTAAFRFGTDDVIKGPRGVKLAQVTGKDAAALYVEEDFLPITYKVDITKKNPVWVDDLKAAADAFGLQSGMVSEVRLAGTAGALVGRKLNMRIDYPTSDIVVTGTRGKNEGKIFATKKFDNESLHWIDIGLVIPLKSVKELKFNDEGRLVQPKPVEKNRIYATVGFFPFGPVNTKGKNLLRLAPEIMYGMALNDNPWNHQLFAVGLGLKWVQPYVGITGTRSAIPAADQTIAGYKWNWKLSYGLQVPISALASFVKK